MAAVRKRIWTVDGETKVGWFCDWYDSKGQRQRKSFAYKKQADAFRIKIESQLLDGSYRAGGDKINIKDACEAFLLYCQGRNARDERMSTKNLVVYRGHIKNHVLNPRHGIHQMVLSHLTARAVSGFRDSLRNHGMTVPTARKVLGTLGSILQFCVQQDWIATNPARGIRVIGNRTEGSKKIVPPSKASMGALIKSADEDLKLMLVFACSTGARAGEQWAARWRDIDFDGGEYNICRRVDAYGEEGPPKSGAGIRTVPISAQLVSLLKAWRLRSRHSRPDDLIFANREGHHVCHDNLVKRQFLPLWRNCKAQRINWHSLRHFAISCWIESGLAPKTIQVFAGHASLSITAISSPKTITARP